MVSVVVCVVFTKYCPFCFLIFHRFLISLPRNSAQIFGVPFTVALFLRAPRDTPGDRACFKGHGTHARLALPLSLRCDGCLPDLYILWSERILWSGWLFRKYYFLPLPTMWGGHGVLEIQVDANVAYGNSPCSQLFVVAKMVTCCQLDHWLFYCSDKTVVHCYQPACCVEHLDREIRSRSQEW